MLGRSVDIAVGCGVGDATRQSGWKPVPHPCQKERIPAVKSSQARRLAINHQRPFALVSVNPLRDGPVIPKLRALRCRGVFTGATSRTTREAMPRGEAQHYRERALELGVPAGAILVEPRARNTGENIALSRALLEVSASASMTFAEYVDSIQDARLVIDMLVGAQQRLMVYPAQGFAISDETAASIRAA